jgi:hypothetical protein
MHCTLTHRALEGSGSDDAVSKVEHVLVLPGSLLSTRVLHADGNRALAD